MRRSPGSKTRRDHRRPRSWKRRKAVFVSFGAAMTNVMATVNCGKVYEGEHTATHWIIVGGAS